ncbi:protein FAM216A-like [Parambassis ranga]|uniref:Protein FAM216A-like n=1 Tax=Parambassis ranga TaxID=210632 RepID=A0A6P7IZX7_9TELE|nr:protein FAM216A [Parambassis ranga]
MMRKRVTFVEHLKKDNLFQNRSGHILMRSAESNKRCADGLECLSHQQVRDMYRGTQINVPAGSQHMKTIHTPKSMMSAPFLQHPALTPGQRRYLCSIASVYSTEHMRRQMKQHYLNLLHTCLQSGQNDTCRRKHGDHQHREDGTKDAEKANMPQRKGSNRTNSDVTLPKIVNR